MREFGVERGRADAVCGVHGQFDQGLGCYVEAIDGISR